MQINFYCRESKADRNGEAPIEMSLSLNGKRCFVNCAMKCSPAQFHKKKRLQYIDNFCDNQRLIVNQAISEITMMQIPLTVQRIREYLKTGGKRSYTIDDLFTEYYAILKKRVGKTLTAPVYSRYEVLRRMFYDFIGKDTEVRSLSPASIQSFYVLLQSKYQESTSGGYMTKLKTVITYARDNGHLSINPFSNIKIKKGIKEIKTINSVQLQAIIDHHFNERLRSVADMFIFSCGSGLAFCDVANLKTEDFQWKGDRLVIIKNRQKTNVKFYSVLLPCAEAVAKKYNYDFSKLHISNQKTNSYLKEIQTLCDIDISLHFHLARHYYAMELLRKGVPITSVSKAIGHTNITMTQHYAKALEETVINDITKII